MIKECIISKLILADKPIVDLDSDIKRKLNPKRISSNLEKDYRGEKPPKKRDRSDDLSGEMEFTTKKKNKKVLDAADEFILSKTRVPSMPAKASLPVKSPVKSPVILEDPTIKKKKKLKRADGGGK